MRNDIDLTFGRHKKKSLSVEDLNKPLTAYGMSYQQRLIPTRVGKTNRLTFYFYKWYYRFQWISKEI